MSHCELGDAMVRAEELREIIETQQPANLPVTTSIGVATLREGGNFESLFRAADAAVYKAKDGGRNCVESADESMEA